jgi:hypothetical protein
MRVRRSSPLPAWSLKLSLLFVLTPSAMPQMANGIFVTSVPDIPFVALSELESTYIKPDGTSVSGKATRAIARDSKGRIFKEGRRFEPITESAPSLLILIDIYEPQTKTYTFLYPPFKTFWKGTLERPPRLIADEYFYGWPTRDGMPAYRLVKEEDLGTQTIDGMPVRGVRETQEVIDESGKKIVTTGEYWYSDELHMNLVATINGPDKSSLTVRVTQVNRIEPDATIFEIPSNYKRTETPIPRPLSDLKDGIGQ